MLPRRPNCPRRDSAERPRFCARSSGARDFTVTLELETGRSYRFRYIIDGWKYENDWYADRYEPNPYGGEDSVVADFDPEAAESLWTELKPALVTLETLLGPDHYALPPPDPACQAAPTS